MDLESTRGEVRSLGKKAGLTYSERLMLDNVIGFSSTEVEEAMVPRADIVAISEKWLLLYFHLVLPCQHYS